MVPVYIYYVSLQALGPDSASVFLASRPGVAGGSWRSSYFCFERTKISSIRHFYVHAALYKAKEGGGLLRRSARMEKNFLPH